MVARTDASESAPAYALESSAVLPPSDTEAAPPYFSLFPTSFTIAGMQVSALVQTSDLKLHLRLLGAFHDLRKRVESWSEGITSELEPAARWSVFISIAVYRFEQYLASCVQDSGNTLEMPPLDVALVWHSYALNPRWYAEDSIRIHPGLERTAGFPLIAIANLIDSSSLQLVPTPQQVNEWQNRTKTPFDPLVSLREATGRPVKDPFSTSGENIFVPFVNAEGTGYAQQKFEATGHGGRKFTHETLGVAKLVQDIHLCQFDANGYLAGTVFSPTEKGTETTMSLLRRTRVKTLLLSGRPFVGKDSQTLGEFMDWSLVEAKNRLQTQFAGKGTRALAGILSAYTRGDPFSLDLVTAVLRQGTFVDKMVGLGWTIPGRFESDQTILMRASCRYFAFLDLMSSSYFTFFVPTLDIDLAWHTHQLLATKYRDDTIRVLGHFVDHNDRVEESALATGYDVTAQAWQARFNVPYSICGCPLPDEKKLSKLSSALGSKLGLSSKKAFTPTSLLGRTSNADDCDATHASAHNSVILIDHPEAKKSREKREKEYAERVQRDEKRGAKCKMDAETLKRRRDGHAAAFLYPITLYPMMYVGGGCAVVAGGYMTQDGIGGAGGCAVGAGACGGVGGIGGSCGTGSGAACAGGGGGGGCGGGGGGGGCGGGGGGGGCGGGGGGN